MLPFSWFCFACVELRLFPKDGCKDQGTAVISEVMLLTRLFGNNLLFCRVVIERLLPAAPFLLFEGAGFGGCNRKPKEDRTPNWGGLHPRAKPKARKFDHPRSPNWGSLILRQVLGEKGGRQNLAIGIRQSHQAQRASGPPLQSNTFSPAVCFVMFLLLRKRPEICETISRMESRGGKRRGGEWCGVE